MRHNQNNSKYREGGREGGRKEGRHIPYWCDKTSTNFLVVNLELSLKLQIRIFFDHLKICLTKILYKVHTISPYEDVCYNTVYKTKN